ncbi:hypothetical protein EDB19DRAFT_1718148 [Suillus lakei]|nr:hypothetical protein EDB19DRAFT_1718148 [Suillus lakei]
MVHGAVILVLAGTAYYVQVHPNLIFSTHFYVSGAQVIIIPVAGLKMIPSSPTAWRWSVLVYPFLHRFRSTLTKFGLLIMTQIAR